MRFALWLVGLSACANVLDLDERNDAVERLCACTDEVPQFEGRCVELLSDRLDTASEATRAAWLEYFAEQCGGDGVCLSAYGCYSQPGTCSVLGCGEARECCGFDGTGNVVCNAEGLCQAAE